MAKKPQKADYDIFISHSSKDIVCAEQCCEYLEKRGYSCFLDKRDMRHKERDTFSEVDFTSCYWWMMKSENSKQLKLSGGRNMIL
jgi:hypothetical protein